jgi:hypothetical protein
MRSSLDGCSFRSLVICGPEPSFGYVAEWVIPVPGIVVDCVGGYANFGALGKELAANRGSSSVDLPPERTTTRWRETERFFDAGTQENTQVEFGA